MSERRSRETACHWCGVRDEEAARLRRELNLGEFCRACDAFLAERKVSTSVGHAGAMWLQTGPQAQELTHGHTYKGFCGGKDMA